jgi:hypothetical protein
VFVIIRSPFSTRFFVGSRAQKQNNFTFAEAQSRPPLSNYPGSHAWAPGKFTPSTVTGKEIPAAS